MSTAAGPPTSDRVAPVLTPSTYDLVLAGVLAVGCVAPYLALHDLTRGMLSFLLVAPLAVRRATPPVALGCGTAAALLALVLSPIPPLGVVAVPVLVYSMARWAGPAPRQIALIAGLAGAVFGPVRWVFFGAYGSEFLLLGLGILTCAGIVLAAYLAGSRRHEVAAAARARDAAERDRDALLQAEDEQRLRTETAWERNRIARELHDIVAHSLSVMVVQAEGGRALAHRRPEEAPAVFGTIAETGREALTEMRRIVAVLRDGTAPDGAYAPTPDLVDLPDLVRRTMPDARLRLPDPLPVVGPTVGLTAYRIVQEALTNVLKHAGPAPATAVTISCVGDTLWVEVVDAGRGAAVESDGSGLGLRGMFERVAAVGGHLLARPQLGGGFEVRAAIPLRPVEPTA